MFSEFLVTEFSREEFFSSFTNDFFNFSGIKRLDDFLPLPDWRTPVFVDTENDKPLPTSTKDRRAPISPGHVVKPDASTDSQTVRCCGEPKRQEPRQGRKVHKRARTATKSRGHRRSYSYSDDEDDEGSDDEDSESESEGESESESESESDGYHDEEMHFGHKGKGKKRSGRKGASSKRASRIFAFHSLFRRQLPSTRPVFVSDEEWKDLKNAEQAKRLVMVTDFRDNHVVLRLPITYDAIVHSLANYGPQLTKHARSVSTRFRWWTDSAMPELKASNRLSGKIVERTIQLPNCIVKNGHLQNLFHMVQHDKLCAELSAFFGSLLKVSVSPKEYEHFKKGKFGKDRKRPRTSSSSPNPESSKVFEKLVELHCTRWS